MEQYANRGGDSGVVTYDIEDEFIKVGFSDGSLYLYTYASPGAADVEHMKTLARRGEGLNEFIKRSVGDRYEQKLK